MKTPKYQSVLWLTFSGNKDFKMSQIMEMLNVQKKWVMKWSVLGKIGEFTEVVFTGSHLTNSKRAGNMKRCHNYIMVSS